MRICAVLLLIVTITTLAEAEETRLRGRVELKPIDGETRVHVGDTPIQADEGTPNWLLKQLETFQGAHVVLTGSLDQDPLGASFRPHALEYPKAMKARFYLTRIGSEAVLIGASNKYYSVIGPMHDPELVEALGGLQRIEARGWQFDELESSSFAALEGGSPVPFWVSSWRPPGSAEWLDPATPSGVDAYRALTRQETEARLFEGPLAWKPFPGRASLQEASGRTLQISSAAASFFGEELRGLEGKRIEALGVVVLSESSLPSLIITDIVSPQYRVLQGQLVGKALVLAGGERVPISIPPLSHHQERAELRRLITSLAGQHVVLFGWAFQHNGSERFEVLGAKGRWKSSGSPTIVYGLDPVDHHYVLRYGYKYSVPIKRIELAVEQPAAQDKDPMGADQQGFSDLLPGG